MGERKKLPSEFMLVRYSQMLENYPVLVDAIIYFAERATTIPERDAEDIDRILREAEGTPITNIETAIFALAKERKIGQFSTRLGLRTWRAYEHQQEGHDLDDRTYELIAKHVTEEHVTLFASCEAMRDHKLL